MLSIHTSNQLERLKNQFSSVINTPLSAPFATETVVVQNAGMARWLSMQLADTTGISANIEFLFPAEFMWRLLRLVSSDIPEKNQCTPETMRFHIMRELSHHADDYPELQHYIHSADNPNKRDELAIWDISCELAQLLDQYLFYRSDWIRNWETSKPQSINSQLSDSSASNSPTHINWQSRIWKRCVQDQNLIHWLALQDQFKESFQLLDNHKLPERILFFSMSALSPGYIDMLGELGEKTAVHLFLINPCQDRYWGDIQSEKNIAKMDLEIQPYMDLQNPILASMGKQGRDFIDKLLSLPNVLEEPDNALFSYIESSNNESSNNEPPNNKRDISISLLKKLQSDISQLTEPKAIIENQVIELDSSITINACHTAMREIEVLHDQILNELDTNQDLAPSDIVVMMPDVEKYAAYIEAVFSASKPALPFSMADREAPNVFQIIEVLEKLFSLPDTRFNVESVFELLNYNDVSDHFNLDENHISKCRELAKATNIRWGISALNRKNNQLPYTEEHTWKYALDRVLLGYSLGENIQEMQVAETLFDSERLLSLLAFTDIEGNEASMLANFKQFTDCVFSINQWHSLRLPIADWINKTKALIQTLTKENADQQLLLNTVSELKALADFTNFDQHIPYSVFNKILLSSLQSIPTNETYLGYGITFCALVPMRSVPFKVVALIGMNDGEFPRQDKHLSFDLMAKKAIKGDRSRRDEDRYLFLESLLAARHKLIINFNGLSVKDNADIPPSVLVNELLETLSIYTNNEPEHLITKHPLQAFSEKYFTHDNLNKSLYSYAKNYCSLDKNSDVPSQQFISQPLETPDNSFKQIPLTELIEFYKNPARYFLKHRFSLRTYEDDSNLAIREPFELETFIDKEVRNLVLKSLTETYDDSQALIARAKGLLPYGQIGDDIYRREKHITEDFVAKLSEINMQQKQNSTHLFNLNITLPIGEFTLHGNIDHRLDIGRSISIITTPYSGDYIDFWLKHLVMNTLDGFNGENASFLYSPDVDIQLTPMDNARSILEPLIEYYWKGLSYPLLFFPKTAFSMYSDSATANRKNAEKKWLGDDRYAGEKDSFEHWLLHRTSEFNARNFPEEFLTISQLIFGDMVLQKNQTQH